MPAQAETRAPVLRIRGDEAEAPLLESLRLSLLLVEPLEPIEGEIGAIGGARHQAVPGRLGALEIALDEAHVAEIQVGRRRVGILFDRRLEMPRRVAAIADAQRLGAELVLEERQDRLVARLRVGAAQRDQLLANAMRVRPLVLLLVELLQVEQRVLIRRDPSGSLR